ncbi:MAG TPA: hypothetical protein VFW79_08210 [Cellulomonas sp.]|uniref:hypothetical protein n=1 Tax=Cellulomonas sp. TaxID=40001 RepID=UPI002E2F4E3E|nr:hypothetical protein [Cellulomonas sp.]HEX5332611.1 hypothetical protein [Cellulomonas sp.]
MTHVFSRRASRVTAVAVLAAVGVLGLPVVQAAVADDATAAWSVGPADATGAADSRTRLELQAGPGASVQDHLVISNASTVERTFSVYGADAFNTGSGGYDLKPAATAAVDVGSWVTVDTPTVTIPALSSAVVAVTVAVPAGAAPGDHPGGIAVSPANPTPDAQGVVVDTRVAVRLNLRVSGELTPALTVRGVHASYGSTWMPFGAAPTTLHYDVSNTGNVKIVGKPRVRVTGPFGVRLAQVDADSTREILPGQTITVESVVRDVEPLALATAVIDVDMAAAPGPDTEIPLVSTSARSTFLAVSWTGLAVIALVAGAVWFVVREVRRRRREGEELWAAMIAEARSTGADPQLLGVGPANRTAPVARPDARGSDPTAGSVQIVVVTVVLAVGALVAAVAMAPTALAAPRDAIVSVDSSDTGSLQLIVPPGPSVQPTGTGAGSASGRGASDGRSAAGRMPQSSAQAAGGGPAPAASAAPAAPAPETHAGLGPDLIWAAWTAHHRTPGQWLILGAGGSGLAAVAGLLARPTFLRARRGGLPA